MTPISAPPRQIEKILAHIRAGGIAFIPTAYRCTVIDKKTLARWDKVGRPLLWEDGETYRMASGRKSVYLLPGQLKLG